jgi:pyruvate-formate lyase-activating enzyme
MSNSNAYHELNFLKSTYNKFKIIGINPKYLIYRLKWNLLGKYPFETKVPTHVDIELSSLCNLKCTMCPHGSGESQFDKGLIDYDLARKVIRECGEYGVTSLKFSGRGEATLHPKFEELVEYAKSLGIMDVMFNTNGLLLTEKRIKRIVDAGVDLIIISIDGVTKETYEKIRVGGDFDKLMHNVNYLLNYRNENNYRKPMVRLQFVKMNENIHEFDKFQDAWRDRVDVLVGLDYSNRMDQDSKSVSSRKAVGRAYCPHPWRRLTVTSGGEALMCCVDWNIKYGLGNARDHDIYQLWNGKKIRHARECIKKLEHHKISSCKDCFAPISYKWNEVKCE